MIISRLNQSSRQKLSENDDLRTFHPGHVYIDYLKICQEKNDALNLKGSGGLQLAQHQVKEVHDDPWIHAYDD